MSLPLAFYDDIRKQDRYKPWTFGIGRAKLITKQDRLIPWQLPKATTGALTHIYLYTKEGLQVMDLLPLIDSTDIDRWSYNGYEVITYYGQKAFLLATTMAIGEYYIVVTDGSTTMYSELFTTNADVPRYIEIRYKNSYDIVLPFGHIDYANGQYEQILYVQGDILMPQYPFTEEGAERDGLFFVHKQVSEKVFNFTIMAPEYLLDALRLVRMHDQIIITDPLYVYDVDQIIITPTWQARGNMASTQIEFHTNTIVKNTACNTNVQQACLAPNLDGVLGILHWTDPPPVMVQIGDRYFRYLGTTYRLYEWNGSQWASPVPNQNVLGNIATELTGGLDWYFLNQFSWKPAAGYLGSCLKMGNIIRVQGAVTLGTKVDVWYKKDVLSSWNMVMANIPQADFNAQGATFSVSPYQGLAKGGKVKIRVHQIGCDYGYSDEITVKPGSYSSDFNSDYSGWYTQEVITA